MGVTRFGVLSTARINRSVLAGARTSDRVEIAAVASRDLDRAEAYAREHGIERAYGSYDELLADPDIEAVYVSLPNSMHVEWSIRALEAGKHVLCEKPLARRAEDAERAFDVAEREGRLLMEAFMYRHNPQTRKAAELVAGGAIGTLRLVSSSFTFPVERPDDVRMQGVLGGGALMDVGCYCVNGARLLAGEPEEVFATQVESERGVDLRLVATMRFPGAVLAHFDCALDLPRRAELEAVGDEGTLLLPDPWIIAQPAILLRRGNEVEGVPVEDENHYGLELENLSAAIRGDAEPLLGRADAVTQARAIEALYRSADEGVPVRA